MIFLQNYLITWKVVKLIVQKVMTFSSRILGNGMFHQCLRKLGHVIVIPWLVRLYVEIIHELKRVDYFTYRWTNMV